MFSLFQQYEREQMLKKMTPEDREKFLAKEEAERKKKEEEEQRKIKGNKLHVIIIALP
jgi:hypothetical protein